MDMKFKNLKWQKQNDWFLLKSAEETLVTVNFKLGNKSIFSISSVNYQLESKGFINQGLLVKANGQEVLEIKNGFWETKSTLTFVDGTIVKQDFKHNGKLALRYFNNEGNILIYSYKTIDRRIKETFSVGEVFIDAEKFLILAALGIIIFTPFMLEINGGSDIIRLI